MYGTVCIISEHDNSLRMLLLISIMFLLFDRQSTVLEDYFGHEIVAIILAFSDLRFFLLRLLMLFFMFKLLLLEFGREKALKDVLIGSFVVHKQIDQVLFVDRSEILKFNFVLSMVHQLKNSFFKLCLFICLYFSRCILLFS